MRLPRILLSIVLLATLCAISHAETRTIWEIGKPDRDFAELAIPRDFSSYPNVFPKDVTFRAGKDSPAKAWPFIHPGPQDAWAGMRVHPFTIAFDLPEEPRGSFKLSIGMVSTHSGFAPTYEVKINDRADTIALPAGQSDAALTDPSKGKPYALNLTLPASYFRKGANTLLLQTIQGSWLLYDALSLTNDPDAAITEPTINSIDLTPTMRFVRRGNKLRQVVQAVASFSSVAAGRAATITANGKTQSVILNSNLLGVASTDIEVDEVSKPTQITMKLASGGQTRSASCELKPQKHWVLYVQASAHVDIGYTDLQERVAKVHNGNMDTALDLCRQYPGFKWNTEAAWVESNYLSTATKERKAEFIKRAQEGRIGCQAVFGNMLTGLCSHEELIRDLYSAKEMSRRYGIPFDIAMSSDVPTQVWTLPTVLAGAGIKYFTAGLNLVRADSFGRLFNKSPFYWQGPDGSKVLTWLAPGYGWASGLALDTDVTRARNAVEGFLRGFDRADYPYDAVLAFGGYADNMSMNPRLAQVVDQWNKTYAYPKIVLCRGPEFFQHIESKFAKRIPTLSGDAGVYWEDGAGSSAHETSLVRCAKQDLASAEKLYTFLSAITGQRYPASELGMAWEDSILYDEHTWGAGGSISEPESPMTTGQWKRKSRFALRSASGASSILQSGLDLLAATVRADAPSVMVFNPLSWPVSGLVRTTGSDGQPVDFWAENVPPMGVKAIPIDQAKTGSSTSTEGSVLENRFYRVEFSSTTGAVKRLYDKELNLELVDPSSQYGINQYAYYSGVGKDLHDATIEGTNTQPSLTKAIRQYGSAMLIKASADNTPSVTTEVILYDNIKRIDFLNTLDKKPTYAKEAGYFAFPFNIQKPKFRIELPNGVLDPSRNMLDGGCMAYYCAQDFVAVSDNKATVVWTAVDNPLVTLCDINRETYQSEFPGLGSLYSPGVRWPQPIDNGRLYAYAFNNYWFTNYKSSQGGRMQFRFSLTSMKEYDPIAASRFGQSVRSPLLGRIATQAKHTAKQTQIHGSFCTISSANVCIQAAKNSSTGKGIIIRLRELSGKQTRTTLSLAVPVHEAWICNLVEDPVTKAGVSQGKITLNIPANGLATVLVR